MRSTEAETLRGGHRASGSSRRRERRHTLDICVATFGNVFTTKQIELNYIR